MFEVLGGRKFLMALVVIIAGVIIELKSQNGLSATMVTLLTAVYATFSTANALVTRKFEGEVETPASEPVEVKQEPKESSSNLTEEVKQLIGQNNVQLNQILTQIATEMQKGSASSSSILEAVNGVQAAQANIQKGITIILSKGT